MRKQLIKRGLALLLIVTTLVTSVPMELLAKRPAETKTEVSENTEGTSADEVMTEDADIGLPMGYEEEKPYIVAELEERRTENSKTFRLSDGSYAVATYDEPVHFLGENEKYIEIDNRGTQEEGTLIKESGQREYKKRLGDKEISFREKSDIKHNTNNNRRSSDETSTTNEGVDSYDESGNIESIKETKDVLRIEKLMRIIVIISL